MSITTLVLMLFAGCAVVSYTFQSKDGHVCAVAVFIEALALTMGIASTIVIALALYHGVYILLT